MNETTGPGQQSTARFDHKVVDEIVRETRADAEVVQRIYQEELAALADGARIAQFLNLLASRRTRLRLREHSVPGNM